MLIGRKQEQYELNRLLELEESQFCVVYGRRRVGKTFLIRETYADKIVFQHTGLANAPRMQQLSEFAASLKNHGFIVDKTPETWFEAFHLLEDYISTLPSKKKKIIFLDELSWMDTPKSSFISALEHFWNGWATARREKDIILIVCGSATSWLINNIVKNHGGLHNRLTMLLYIKPFSLHDCEQYAQNMGITLSRKELAEAYMIMGGIPYYWSFLRRGESLSQNIDRIFFGENAPLANEFSSLYASLFKNAENHISIITALATKKVGMTRNELIMQTKKSDNATLNKTLTDLEQCNFIRVYYPFGKDKKNALYQLMDNYTLFYFQYIKTRKAHDNHFWTNKLGTSLHNTWRGLAFERLCLWHLPQIKQALGINGVIASACSWYTKGTEEYDGAQIDLIIDRNDMIVNLCEIKFSDAEYAINKKEDAKLRNRLQAFKLSTHTKKAVHYTMITPYGIRRNEYSGDIQSQVTIEDLFAV